MLSANRCIDIRVGNYAFTSLVNQVVGLFAFLVHSCNGALSMVAPSPAASSIPTAAIGFLSLWKLVVGFELGAEPNALPAAA